MGRTHQASVLRGCTVKIEWLNEELTKARLTRGWFKKRQTVVIRKETKKWFYEANGYYMKGFYNSAYMERKRLKKMRVTLGLRWVAYQKQDYCEV